MFTEEDAKTKWCPQVRYLAIFRDAMGARECSGAYNRAAEDIIGTSKCIASDCMMWRFENGSPAYPATKGFCGLAGKE